MYTLYHCIDGLDGVSFCKGLKWLGRKTNQDQQLLLCSLEMTHCLFHMLVTHVWYVSHPSINLGAHEPYGCFPALFLRNLELSIDIFSNSIPLKYTRSKGNTTKNRKKKKGLSS